MTGPTPEQIEAMIAAGHIAPWVPTYTTGSSTDDAPRPPSGEPAESARAVLGVDQEVSTARTDAPRDAMERLARFGAWAMEELRGDNLGGDIDGGAGQDEAVRLGVLVEVRVTEPCGEQCACAEYVGDFPVECYRYPAEITRALRTLMLTERAPVPAVETSRSTPNDALTSTAPRAPQPVDGDAPTPPDPREELERYVMQLHDDARLGAALRKALATLTYASTLSLQRYTGGGGYAVTANSRYTEATRALAALLRSPVSPAREDGQP